MSSAYMHGVVDLRQSGKSFINMFSGGISTVAIIRVRSEHIRERMEESSLHSTPVSYDLFLTNNIIHLMYGPERNS